MQKPQTKADPSGMTTRKAKGKAKGRQKAKADPPPDYPNEQRALIGDPVRRRMTTKKQKQNKQGTGSQDSA
jgi:hypothetical protein